MGDLEPVKRRKHLMDPANPRPVSRPGDMKISKVQQWVLSALALVTIMLLSIGLVFCTALIDEDRRDARIGLLVVAGAFGLVAMGTARAIHLKSLASPWLVVGLVPALVGAWFVLR